MKFWVVVYRRSWCGEMDVAEGTTIYDDAYERVCNDYAIYARELTGEIEEHWRRPTTSYEWWIVPVEYDEETGVCS